MRCIVLTKLIALVAAFASDEDGPTAVEYAVLLALVFTVCVATISVLGSNSNNTFKRVSTSLSSGS
jgi:pilus assembly protein Flp/PilA